MLKPKKTFDAPCVMGDESIMAQKSHGTSAKPVQNKLRWGCKVDLADRICNFNRHYAENAGYWLQTSFLNDEAQSAGDLTFYDSVTGKPLFTAGKERSWDAFVKESKSHGWPSFRDSEVKPRLLALAPILPLVLALSPTIVRASEVS